MKKTFAIILIAMCYVELHGGFLQSVTDCDDLIDLSVRVCGANSKIMIKSEDTGYDFEPYRWRDAEAGCPQERYVTRQDNAAHYSEMEVISVAACKGNNDTWEPVGVQRIIMPVDEVNKINAASNVMQTIMQYGPNAKKPQHDEDVCIEGESYTDKDTGGDTRSVVKVLTVERKHKRGVPVKEADLVYQDFSQGRKEVELYCKGFFERDCTTFPQWVATCTWQPKGMFARSVTTRVHNNSETKGTMYSKGRLTSQGKHTLWGLGCVAVVAACAWLWRR